MWSEVRTLKNTTKNYNSGSLTKCFNCAKNLSLQKVVELRMEPISQNKDDNISKLEALKDNYLNE